MLKAQEKQGLLPGPAQPVSRSSSTRLVLLFAIALLALLHLPHAFFLAPKLPTTSERTLCPQADSLAPSTNDRLDSHRDLVFGEKYRNSSAAILGGLVRVKSESFDGEKDDDPRWDAFYDIANYLRRTFPLVYKHLALEEVNTHGLLYTFAGSDTSLKPIILMAHTDTVPVNPDTLDQWSYEPWSGFFDGEYLWGRGATDCKNLVSGILEAVTLLLEGGFKPRRTVLISFGFDEESRGWGGAGELAKVIEQRYGKDGVAFLVDEGGMGVAESAYGFPIALPAVTEKGYLNANFTLHTAGGHSSVPPAHSGIGIISTLVSALEAHPFTPSLPLWSPTFSVLQCAAAHGNLSSSIKRNVERGNADSRAGDRARQQLVEDYARLGAFERFTVQTSQAVDIVHGGVKVNVLPELVNLVVNYRVDIASSTEEVKEHIRKVIKPVAEQYGLEVNAFGDTYSPSSGVTSSGKLDIVATVEHPAAPLSPTVDNPAWDVFAGTIKHVFQPRFGDEKENPLVVSPSLMLGNTDVRWYTALSLTPNAYRFTPLDRAKSFGQHTVDERLWFEDHLAAVWWYHELIRNADEAGFA